MEFDPCNPDTWCTEHGPPESYTADRFVNGDGAYPHPPCESPETQIDRIGWRD